jgi:hypothetical protein
VASPRQWWKRWEWWLDPPNLLSDTLRGQDTFFAGPGMGPDYDWPNPRLPIQPQENRGFVHGTNPCLIGQDQFFANPGQTATYDWPNPARPRQPAQADQPPNLLAGTLGQVQPFSQTDWPNPLQVRRAVQPDSQTSLLVGLLSVPFLQSDWPLPQVPRQPQDNRGFVHGTNLCLIGQDVLFGAPGETSLHDWPNPLLPRQPQENRGFTRGSNIQLIGQDQFPTRQQDWPNPLRPRQPNQADCQSSLLVEALAVPFNQTHWPNPLLARQPQENQGFVRGVDLCLAGQDGFFDGAGRAPVYDWPNPLRPRYPIQPEAPPDLLASTLGIPPPQPFSQTDWPLPSLPRQAQENRGFLHSTCIGLIGKDQFYGAPGQAQVYDWANPQQRRYPLQPESLPNLLSSTLGQAPTPFQQHDWPNPQQPKRPAQADCQTSLLVGPLAIPFHQTDWPLPQVPRQSQENRGFLRAANTQLIGQDRIYGAPGETRTYDYPNPQTARQPQENKGFIGQPLLRFVGLDSFFGAPGQAPVYDYPNPLRPRYPIWPEPPPNILTTGTYVPVVPTIFLTSNAQRNVEVSGSVQTKVMATGNSQRNVDTMGDAGANG